MPVVNLEANRRSTERQHGHLRRRATIQWWRQFHAWRVFITPKLSLLSPVNLPDGTRANIDEFTETTSRAIEVVGGAAKGKAIIVLNPAEPPLMMRDTVYVLSDEASQDDIEASINEMAEAVQAYVPGYRLKQRVQFEVIPQDKPVNLPGVGQFSGLKTAVWLEVEGAAHYLPAYAGNLDIMTSSALATAENGPVTGAQGRRSGMNGKNFISRTSRCVTVCTPFVISIRWKTFARLPKHWTMPAWIRLKWPMATVCRVPALTMVSAHIATLNGLKQRRMW